MWKSVALPVLWVSRRPGHSFPDAEDPQFDGGLLASVSLAQDRDGGTLLPGQRFRLADEVIGRSPTLGELVAGLDRAADLVEDVRRAEGVQVDDDVRVAG